MATLTIRGVDDETHALLRVRAARHGRSMEAEVRALLTEAVSLPPVPERGLGSRIHSRFARERTGLEPPRRTEPARAAVFDA